VKYDPGSFPEVEHKLEPGEGYELLKGHEDEQYGLEKVINTINVSSG
jgi:hypothetical protein